MTGEQIELSKKDDFSLPLITVGIPTYNRPDGLEKCLNHLSQQTYKNIGIIISDNASTDPKVQQVILDFAKRDSRIKYIRQTENIGMENNFNFLFQKAKGEYFMWMSDDDYFDDDYIEKCIDFLQKNLDYVLCSGQSKYYSGDRFMFDEKMFLVNQPTILKRLFCFFTKVGKNGNFYGVYRKNIFNEKPLVRHIGCDWVFMGDMAVFGKLGYLITTSYSRSFDGASASRKSMIKRFQFKGLKAFFFETYTAYIISSNLFKNPSPKSKMNFITRKFFRVMVFFLLNWKYFINSISRRLSSKKI